MTPAQLTDRSVDMVHAVLSARDAPVGITPKELVWRKNKACLYRYQRATPPTRRGFYRSSGEGRERWRVRPVPRGAGAECR